MLVAVEGLGGAGGAVLECPSLEQMLAVCSLSESELILYDRSDVVPPFYIIVNAILLII